MCFCAVHRRGHVQSVEAYSNMVVMNDVLWAGLVKGRTVTKASTSLIQVTYSRALLCLAFH